MCKTHFTCFPPCVWGAWRELSSCNFVAQDSPPPFLEEDLAFPLLSELKTAQNGACHRNQFSVSQGQRACNSHVRLTQREAWATWACCAPVAPDLTGFWDASYQCADLGPHRPPAQGGQGHECQGVFICSSLIRILRPS